MEDKKNKLVELLNEQAEEKAKRADRLAKVTKAYNLNSHTIDNTLLYTNNITNTKISTIIHILSIQLDHLILVIM